MRKAGSMLWGALAFVALLVAMNIGIEQLTDSGVSDAEVLLVQSAFCLLDGIVIVGFGRNDFAKENRAYRKH